MDRYKVEFEIEPTLGTIGEVRADIDGWSVPLPAGVIEGTVKVERLPDPPIVQEFRVRVESPSSWKPLVPDSFTASLERNGYDLETRKVMVTEVTE